MLLLLFAAAAAFQRTNQLQIVAFNGGLCKYNDEYAHAYK